MLFSQFSQHLQQIEATTKRLEMTALLAQLYTELSGAGVEIEEASYLLQGKLVPKYEPLEFQISTKMSIRVLAKSSGKSEEEVTKSYKQLGDLGLVAEESLGRRTENQAEHNATIHSVFTKLYSMAVDSGKGSQERKVDQIVELIQSVDPVSAKYIVRIIIGKLRLGFSDMTMIDALSWASVGDKSIRDAIEDAYQKRVDIGYIAKIVLEHGEKALAQVEVKVGTPVVPALCQRLNSAQDIIEKMGCVLAEPKYDGTRVQIHIQKKIQDPRSRIQGPRSTFHIPHSKHDAVDPQLTTHNSQLVRSFTRNLEESSHMFPELSQLVEELDCDSCILDSEAIGFHPETGELLPFQQTIQRKRKHGVAESAVNIPLRFFIFDVLAKDDQSLLRVPLLERKNVLKGLFKDSVHFVHAPYTRIDDAAMLHQFHEAQLAAGLEGAVMKKVDSFYQSGRKAFSWVKIKEPEGSRGKLSDTLDCIVMGYWKATGARVGFEIGSLLLGILDEQQRIVTISKVGSGLSEELAQQLTQALAPYIAQAASPLFDLDNVYIPDVWVSPHVVVEIAADEITTSPSHSAGVALRFPRIIRIRTDKGWEQATTLQEVKGITLSIS